MVQSAASDVDGYLAEVPAQRRPVLDEVRRLCRDELAGFDEVMMYGMPAYVRDGACEFAFASQKQHISLYLMRDDVREAFSERLSAHDMGKSCLRFRRPEQVDTALVRDLLRATAERRGTVC